MYKVFSRKIDGWFVVVNALDKIVGYSIYKNLSDAQDYCNKLNENQMKTFTGRYVKDLFKLVNMVENG